MDTSVQQMCVRVLVGYVNYIELAFAFKRWGHTGPVKRQLKTDSRLGLYRKLVQDALAPQTVQNSRVKASFASQR